jgi:hypothetical protein
MGKVLSAQGSGYFPICIPEGTPPEPRRHLSLTLQQAMSLFWKVKTWEAKVTGSVYYDDDYSITYLLSTYQEMQRVQPLSGLNSEEDYLCNGASRFSFRTPTEYSYVADGQSPIIIPYNFRFFYNFNPDSGSGSYRNGNLFYPAFETELEGGVSSWRDDNTIVGTLQISLNGFTISRDLYFTDGRSASGNVLIEIRAKEYWSYGGTYNTQTGAPL